MSVSARDVELAAGRLRGIAVSTPLIRSAELDRLCGGTVWVKPECLQRTGSFKIRGAYNLMSQLPDAKKANGVVAWSSGNHAQGVAEAGRLLGIATAIVMPEDAPRAKLENTKRLGGEVITYDRYSGDREAIARQIAVERDAEIVPSYDHPHIIAGQGTVGLEIADQAQALGSTPDQVLICCGGGGLSSGSATALKDRLPDVAVHTVEPDQFDDTARSLRIGKRVIVKDSVWSICDALQAQTPGRLTFALNRTLIESGLSVTDSEVRDTMRFAFRYLKLVIEPGGAVALAAELTRKVETAQKTTVVIASGGNVDFDLFASILREAD